ncbi:MAG: carboxypeptidase regulatory-like domain-containing protein [Candidatus Kapabacteria bacterium]|nr:carboxypeptidase regulatory-like domain-containing protein [Candidatus Kapabacteria bacterium]
MNKVQKSILMLLALSLFALFTGSLAAQEASPQPQEVFGYYSSFEKQIFLDWQIYERNDEILSFNVLLQKIEEDGSISAEYEFAFGINDENLFYKNDGNRFYYNYMQPNYDLEDGTYLLTMNSVSKDGESLPSKESFLWIDNGENREKIYFSEYPDMQATVGKLYKSSVKAESWDGEMTINYSLTEAPEGMTIGTVSGEIEYTPVASGNLYFVIRAFNADDESEFAEVYFMLNVLSCENPATISGKISYNDSLTTKGGIIFVYQKMNDGLIYQSAGTEVFENGEFSVSVDKGEHYVYFMSFDPWNGGDYFNEGEWYKDALTMEQAEPIIVDCGETVNIEMKVGDQSLYTKYKVSGTVSMEDGTPLPYSSVMFESTAAKDDSTFWGGFYKSIQTDENGYYEILLPDIFTYRVSCYAGIKDNPGNYRPQYWENTFNPIEATELKLTEDMAGIDFIFKESDFEFPDGSISGKVVNTDNTPLEGAFVIAFMVKSLNGERTDELYQGFAAITNSEGEYRFDYMNYGEYVLFAFPNDMNYAPGFYREDDVAALVWEDASIILHDGFNPSKDRDIILPLMEIVQGIGKIEGEVTSAGGGIRNDEAGEALSGASIFLVSEKGTTNKYNKSTINGTYQINGIAAGKYQFIVDKVGYKSHKEMIEVGADGNITGLDVALIPEGTTSVNDNNVSLGLNVYPNPAVEQIQLSINAISNSLTVEVYNLTGEKLLSKNINSLAGDGIYSISVSELSTGMYILKVIDGQNVRLDKFIVNK